MKALKIFSVGEVHKNPGDKVLKKEFTATVLERLIKNGCVSKDEKQSDDQSGESQDQD